MTRPTRGVLPGPFRSVRYGLFDGGLALAAAGLLGYVLTTPTEATREALYGPLTFAPDGFWGGLFIAAGLAGAACAYMRPARFVAGRSIVLTVAGSWSLILIVGVGVYLARHLEAVDVGLWHLRIVPGMVRDVVGRGLLSALIFGMIASHVARLSTPE